MADLKVDGYGCHSFDYDEGAYEVPKEVQMENKSEWEMYPDKKPEDGKWVLVAFYDEDQKVLMSGIYDAASETVLYTAKGALTNNVYLTPKSYSANLNALSLYALIAWKYLGDMNPYNATGESFPDELFT